MNDNDDNGNNFLEPATTINVKVLAKRCRIINDILFDIRRYLTTLIATVKYALFYMAGPDSQMPGLVFCMYIDVKKSLNVYFFKLFVSIGTRIQICEHH